MVTLPKTKRTPSIGDSYGRLSVIGKPFRCHCCDRNKQKRTYVVCKCDCGDIDFYDLMYLKVFHTQSCGCLNSDLARERWSTSGGVSVSHPEIHKAWTNLVDRCTNKNHRKYAGYGGRGITVCDEWINSPQNFVAWSLENGWAKGLEIDRIDNNSGYSPGNCRWVTDKQNAQNTRRNVYVSAFGESKTLSEWARDSRSRFTATGISTRIKSGLSCEDAICGPDMKKGPPVGWRKR